ARAEAVTLLSATGNLFGAADGQRLFKPSRDVVLGCYHLTMDPLAPSGADHPSAGGGDRPLRPHVPDADVRGEGMAFASPAEGLLPHAAGKVGLHARIRLRLPAGREVISEVRHGQYKVSAEALARSPGGLVRTTVGRVLFNDILPPRMPFYDLPLT